MNERHEKILELVTERGRVTVGELARRLYVCEMTIRRDLKALADEGRIRRYNGGAMPLEKETEFSFSDRKLLSSKEKMKLARRAVEYVKDGSVVFLDSSSTCSYLVPLLSARHNVKLVTSSIAAAVLAVRHSIPCLLAGGMCYGRDLCTVGPFATDMLEKINIDIAFFSSNAISSDGLITDDDAEQTAVRRTVMKHAEQSIFLFTKPKQNKTCLYTVCKAEDAFAVILE